MGSEYNVESCGTAFLHQALETVFEPRDQVLVRIDDKIGEFVHEANSVAHLEALCYVFSDILYARILQSMVPSFHFFDHFL